MGFAFGFASGFAADSAVLLDRLDAELGATAQSDEVIFAKVIAGACTRLSALNKAIKARRIDRLIGAGAWVEAALALIELELPAWTVRASHSRER